MGFIDPCYLLNKVVVNVPSRVLGVEICQQYRQALVQSYAVLFYVGLSQPT